MFPPCLFSGPPLPCITPTCCDSSTRASRKLWNRPPRHLTKSLSSRWASSASAWAEGGVGFRGVGEEKERASSASAWAEGGEGLGGPGRKRRGPAAPAPGQRGEAEGALLLWCGVPPHLAAHEGVRVHD